MSFCIKLLITGQGFGLTLTLTLTIEHRAGVRLGLSKLLAVVGDRLKEHLQGWQHGCVRVRVIYDVRPRLRGGLTAILDYTQAQYPVAGQGM